MLNISVDDSKLSLFIDFSNRRMVQYMKFAIQQAGAETAAYVQSRYLTGGTTPDRLGVRTGLLRKSAHGLKPMEVLDRVIGGAGIGGARGDSKLIYAPVHIAPQGTKTKITPKKAKNLAIPFRGWASRTGDIGYGWQKRPSPLDYSKRYLRPIKSKKGNILLAHIEYNKGSKKVKGKGFGKSRIGGGVKTITPYYLLLKSVTVPARVFPEWVMNARRRYIVTTIRNMMSKQISRATR